MSALKICPTCSAEYPANERFCPKDGASLRTQGSAAGDLVGSVIAERYHVIRKLGEGGMGTVYLAEHVKMGRKSAVKVMHPGMGQDADALSRFNREASNASRINHPNVAGIYDFGEATDGLVYLAMELVEGESLTSVVAAHGALPPLRAADITRQAAEGLSVAHDMGIVHRDLKPDNIMLAKNRDGSDCVKLVDFGIAKADNDAQKVTKTGLVVGTPEYMSPEQLAGDKLDGRSDVYSLGLVAFHMLTGELPFPSETAQEAMIMRLTDHPKTLAEMKPGVAWTPAVQAVMDRALARDAKARYQTAAELGRDLYEAVQAMPESSAAMAGTLVMDAPASRAGRARGTDVAGAARSVPPTRVAPAGPAARIDEAAPVNRRNRPPILIWGGLAAVLVLGGAVFALRRNASPAGQGDAAAMRAAASRPVADTAPSVEGVAQAATPSSAPDTETPRREGSVPAKSISAPGADAVSPRVSYTRELAALSETVTDPESARKAERELGTYRSRVRTRSDSAIVALIDAKAAMYTGGATRGCGILRRIDRSVLDSTMKQEVVEGLQTCEGS